MARKIRASQPSFAHTLSTLRAIHFAQIYACAIGGPFLMKNSQCARTFAGFGSFQRQRVVVMAPLSSSLALFLCCCIALCVGMNEEQHR